MFMDKCLCIQKYTDIHAHIHIRDHPSACTFLPEPVLGSGARGSVGSHCCPRSPHPQLPTVSPSPPALPPPALHFAFCITAAPTTSPTQRVETENCGLLLSLEFVAFKAVSPAF